MKIAFGWWVPDKVLATHRAQRTTLRNASLGDTEPSLRMISHSTVIFSF